MSTHLNFSEEIKSRQEHATSLISDQPRQRFYAMITHRLEHYKRDLARKFNWIFVISFLAFISGFVGSYLILSLIYVLTGWLLPDQVHHLIMYALSAGILAFGFIIKIVAEEEEVTPKKPENGVIKAWSWGRLDNIIDPNASSAFCLFLGILVATQVCMLQHHTTHLDLGEAMSFTQAFVLSIDNLLHGICLDILEMYQLHLSALDTKPPTFTTTVFLIFRLVYDALFLMWLYLLYQRYQLRDIFKEYPTGAQQDIEPLLKWMQSLCAHPKGWVRRFTDEFIFLMMCEEYLRGNYEVVKHLGVQFNSLRVSDEMRLMFIHPETGEELFMRSAEIDSGAS
jgi:hypothetical protein